MYDGLLVIHYYKSTIDGVMTSMIDQFFNLRRGLGNWEVGMKIICPELYLMDIDDYYNFPLEETQWYEYTSKTGLDVTPYEHPDTDLVTRNLRLFNNELTTSIPFLRYNRNFGDFNLLYSITQDENKFKAHTVVCSARLIYEILMGADIEIECERLFVLDSLDTWKSKIEMFPDFDDLFSTMFRNSQVIQFSNPATFRETKYDQREYYHKLSYRRLHALKQSDRIKDEYIFNRTKKEKTMITEGCHFENMGKGIFEHLYFGKKVLYQKEGMFTKDGLWYYLNKLGVDADKDCILECSKEEIKANLFMSLFDEIYSELI